MSGNSNGVLKYLKQIIMILVRGKSPNKAADRAKDNVREFYQTKFSEIIKLIEKASKAGKEHIEIPDHINGALITMLKAEGLQLATGLNTWTISWVL
jgi:hypothetical protein